MSGNRSPFSFTRRGFLKGLGTSAVAAAANGARGLADELKRYDAEQLYGPGPVPLRLRINGETFDVEAAPHETLLDVLRDRLPLTGAKEACGRASCGACTVLLDGRPVYACSLLAIEAQAHEVTTVEGLAHGEALSGLQEAFIEEDGLQCGYCTSGFLLSLTALLAANPHPTEAEVRQACEGHLCRCGAYPRIYASALRASGGAPTSHLEVIRLSHGQQMA